MSASDGSLKSTTQAFSSDPIESDSIQKLIVKLDLKKHPEGGYYVETDRDPLQVHNPFCCKDEEHPLLAQSQRP